MSKVKLTSEFNAMMRFAKDNALSLRERMLWVALLYIANDRAQYDEQAQTYEWPDDFIFVSHSELNLYSCLDKRAIDTARNALKQYGVIDFVPGVRKKRNPGYRLNYLSTGTWCKNVPNQTPVKPPSEHHERTQTDTVSAPNTAPNDRVFGYKNVPNGRTINLDKINRYNPDLDLTQSGEYGLVDLNNSAPDVSGLVPLPWEA